MKDQGQKRYGYAESLTPSYGVSVYVSHLPVPFDSEPLVELYGEVHLASKEFDFA